MALQGKAYGIVFEVLLKQLNGISWELVRVFSRGVVPSTAPRMVSSTTYTTHYPAIDPNECLPKYRTSPSGSHRP